MLPCPTTVAHTATLYQVVATQGRARTARMTLPHYTAETPMFMPVGTQGTVKGLTAEQLQELDCHVILGNTYHLENRPGAGVVARRGGLHGFSNWPRGMLTDSGGFQVRHVRAQYLAYVSVAHMPCSHGVFRSPKHGDVCTPHALRLVLASQHHPRWFRCCTSQTSRRRVSRFKAPSTASACCSLRSTRCTSKTSSVCGCVDAGEPTHDAAYAQVPTS